MTSSSSKLSDTLIYSGSAIKNDKDVHVLAYQNTAHSYGPNAMILPFPTSKTMDESNIIDTRTFPAFLKNISNASKVKSFSLGEDRLSAKGLSRSIAKVFDVGSYTVVLAESAFQIPEALSRVNSSKRPTVSSEFLIGFNSLYPDRPIALCCWEGNVKAEPLLWWYEPTDPNVLFVPTMDAHDGQAPDTKSFVDTDHIISIGSTDEGITGKHNPVLYMNEIPSDVRSLLPDHVYGTQVKSRIKNGDMFANATKMGGATGKDVPNLYRGTYAPDAFAVRMYGWS